MIGREQVLAGAATLALLIGGSAALAAQARFHYVPVDASGNTRLQPSTRFGSPGERMGSLGLRREPYHNQPRPNQLVTFRHPNTGQNITVPLWLPQALPSGMPRMEYRSDRVIYNYGSYAVEVRFFQDGSADVVYDSGLLRDL